MSYTLLTAMRFKLLSISVVAFVLVAAGCGGGKKSSAPASATTTSAATTTEGATTTAAPTFASKKNCAELLGLGAKFAKAFGAASGNSKTSITDVAKVFEAMASAAPSEIRGDFKTVATAFTVYARAAAKAGIKAGKPVTAAQIAQLQTAASSFNGPKLRAASQRLSAWGQKNCGLPTTTTTTTG